MESRGSSLAMQATATIALAGAAAFMIRNPDRRATSLVIALLAAGAASVFFGLVCSSRRRASQASFAQYPRQYIAKRGTPPVIDGNVYKKEWNYVPWSEPFVEIRGDADAPPGTGPSEAHTTRMKMMWDDEYLYIAAVMDCPAGDEIVAKFTERNSPIFHTDSDFEVFIDPSGCCHGYKELELNPINTVWNLMLTRPYMDGGGELSGRVAKKGESNYWEVMKQKTATRVLRGALHDPSGLSQWCCELALAHEDTLPHSPVTGQQPSVGASWRINFSRVEKGGQVNWVWAPQVVWSPQEKRYTGQVNMHLPDAWGYVVFADADMNLANGQAAADWRDPAWPVRHAAVCLYYALRAYFDENQDFPHSADDLHRLHVLDIPALEGLGVSYEYVKDEMRYDAKVTNHAWEAAINHQRLLRVRPRA